MSCVLCVFSGAFEPSRELRCAEALGRAPVLPAGQPEVASLARERLDATTQQQQSLRSHYK